MNKNTLNVIDLIDVMEKCYKISIAEYAKAYVISRM